MTKGNVIVEKKGNLTVEFFPCQRWIMQHSIEDSMTTASKNIKMAP